MIRLFAALAFLFVAQAAHADRLDVTCQTLGEVGQCERVSICRMTPAESNCVSKVNDPQWIHTCSQLSKLPEACGFVPNCQMETKSFCVPKGR